MSDDVKDEHEEYKSELEHEENSSTRRVQAYAIIFFSAIVLILLFLYFFKGKSIDEDKKEHKRELQKIEKKDFSLEKPKEQNLTFEEIISPKKEIENEKEKEQLPFAPEITKTKPLIIKNINHQASEPKVNANSQDTTTRSTNTFLPPDENTPHANTLEGEDKDFIGSVFTPSIARKNRLNPNFLLPKGAYIGCSLKTRIISSVKGGIACTISNNVYSANGNTLLIERGSMVTGFFKSAELDDGMDRIFVVWQEIRTPRNVIIPVFSGASDELGASGIVGWVDHHYLKRFGSAILVSIIDDTSSVLASRMAKNENSVDYTENSRERTKEMTNTILEKMINIKPTLYKNQGDLVGIYVNRDIDFSKVYSYKLKARR